MGKIILSAFADEYSAKTCEQLAMLRQQNIPLLEPRFLDGKNISAMTTEEVKALKAQLNGIRISSIGSPLGKINLADDFGAHLELTRRVCETANILQTPRVRMFSFYLHQGKSREDCRSEVIDKLGAMLDIARSHNVTFCHENEANIYGESPEQCLDLLKTFGGELKCVFDMGNFVLGGYKPYPEAYELLKDYIEYFHIKDATFAGAIVPPGCGQGCIGDILRTHLAEAETDVIATLEPHLMTFAGLDKLTDRRFDNPYVYENEQTAFLAAVEHMCGVLQDVTE